ncbi:hypothetical protein E2C01_036448 [Portunus trituberculatus]|uniref:Uncharacterized protein n=1 Tax=Portunus trituberculatus TaxID=210409 RepID=A0A5B7FB71_PORTR|nr:hypothetical protein [Portunus trituberculatus]
MNHNTARPSRHHYLPPPHSLPSPQCHISLSLASRTAIEPSPARPSPPRQREMEQDSTLHIHGRHNMRGDSLS